MLNTEFSSPVLLGLGEELLVGRCFRRACARDSCWENEPEWSGQDTVPRSRPGAELLPALRPGEGAADTLLRSELQARGPSHLEARVPLNRGWNPREYSPLSPRVLPASTHPKCHGQNLSSLFQNAPSFL